MLLLVLLAAAAAQPAADPPAPIAKERVLREQIARADAEFFALYFNGPCDLPRLQSMLAEAAEFHHQRHGSVPRERFVGHYLEDCQKREAPRARRVRREVVPGSLTVSPIGRQGAFQTAELNFYAKRAADPAERLVGREKLAQLWVLGADGKWRISRSFSYELRRP